MNFVNQFEKTEESVSNNPLMKESSVAPQDSEESVESSTLIHDGAELVGTRFFSTRFFSKRFSFF